MNSHQVRAALDRAFAPDVTVKVGGDYHAAEITTHTPTGICWFNRTRKRYGRNLCGLSIDALMEDSPGVTFETINCDLEESAC